MGLIRLFLVAALALSTSFSAAMGAGHTAVFEHSHMAVVDVADDQPFCCLEGSERSLTCHALAALLPGADDQDAAPASCGDVVISDDLLLTGIEPSGPLDPPRAV